MNPRATVADPAKIDNRTSPFEQISTLENEQEARVVQAIEGFAAEERDSQKAMANAEKLHEEKAREEAREELKEYAKKEPAAILAKAEEETEADLKAITKQYQKQAPQIVDSLVESVLN